MMIFVSDLLVYLVLTWLASISTVPFRLWSALFSVILVCIMFPRETQSHVTSATKRSAIALKDDNDDDDCVTFPSTFSDHEPPEAVRRRAPLPPEPEKNVDDELVPSARSPTVSGFQLMTSSSGVAAPPPLSTYRSAARILAPPPAPSATAFQLAAFHSIYASQQQQHQMRQNHQLSPHLRFTLFTDAASTPGTLYNTLISAHVSYWLLPFYVDFIRLNSKNTRDLYMHIYLALQNLYNNAFKYHIWLLNN